MIQNKFHYAITGNTVAEIIYKKADYTRESRHDNKYCLMYFKFI